jgi:hypothetical protein
MGVDLYSDSGDDTGFGYMGWSMVLQLAQQYGWQPQGTEPPEGMDNPQEWAGGYGSSDGQRVTAADAKALAEALAAAVADPNLHVAVMRMDSEQRRDVQARVGPELAASFVGVRDFEEYRRCLRDFSEFCRKGPFVIE